MARIARKNYNTSFFHVIVQGIEKKYIFKTKYYMQRYIELLNKYEKEHKVIVLSYCIMNNHAHMLIYTEKVQYMSKFMHKINSIYGEYYNYKENNRVGYVFRDRFKCQPIYDIQYLIKCINYIHLNPVKALITTECKNYKYSSYNYYLSNIYNNVDKKIKFIKNILGENYMDILNQNMKNTNIFYDIDQNILEILDNRILMFLEKENKKISDIFENRQLFVRLIKSLYSKDYKIDRKNIMEKFGICKDKFYEIIRE